MSKMHQAARNNSTDELQELLVSGLHDINEKDGMKRTPLHLACWAGHVETVKLLLRFKAKTDALGGLSSS
jgi:ankyrin repeat protein